MLLRHGILSSGLGTQKCVIMRFDTDLKEFMFKSVNTGKKILLVISRGYSDRSCKIFSRVRVSLIGWEGGIGYKRK